MMETKAPDHGPALRGLVIYTWGYQGETVETLQALRQARNALVVDTRYVPSSRDARWRRAHLEKRLGGDYLWLKGFGNRNYLGGWTDPVVLDDPEAGLAALEPLISPARPPILLCMCPTPYCHRTDVAAWLQLQRGWTIEHLPQRGWRTGDYIGPPKGKR